MGLLNSKRAIHDNRSDSSSVQSMRKLIRSLKERFANKSHRSVRSKSLSLTPSCRIEKSRKSRSRSKREEHGQHKSRSRSKREEHGQHRSRGGKEGKGKDGKKEHKKSDGESKQSKRERKEGMAEVEDKRNCQKSKNQSKEVNGKERKVQNNDKQTKVRDKCQQQQKNRKDPLSMTIFKKDETPKKDESRSSSKIPSETQTSSGSIHRDKERIVQTRSSFRDMLRSWRRTRAARSPTASNRQSTRERIKKFFSRPMQEASLQKVVEKIRMRNELRKESASREGSPDAPLRRADEQFPYIKKRADMHSLETKERSVPRKNEPPVNIITIKNKDNEGRLFDDEGRPFWSSASKVNKETDDANEPTDEDLPLDSELLLEVQAGLRKLVKMPETRIVMDPYRPLEYLKSRDKTFFVTNVIFSNTVRSMVNLVDEVSTREILSKRSKRLGKITISEPKTITRYDQDNPQKHERLPIPRAEK